MPAKFKESEGLYRNRKRVGNKHYYMQSTPTAEILEAYERDSTVPKLKDKYKKELVKRGVLSY